MAEGLAPRTSPIRPFDVDTVALLAGVAESHVDAVAQLVRERDNLFHLQEALLEAEQAPTLVERLRVFTAAIRKIGFERVVIALRDSALNPTLIVTAGLSAHEERDLRERPDSGETWQRRFVEMERFRISQSWYLDARDPWVQAEFRTAVPSALQVGDDPEWSPGDVLIVPLRHADGSVVATLMLDDPGDRRRPTLVRVRTVELFGQQVAYQVEQSRLMALARRRAERLQRLHEAGTMLARSLDERQVVRELGRQLLRVLPARTVVIAQPDLERGRSVTALRLVEGVERPRAEQVLEEGVISEVARTGRPVRIADFDPATEPLAAADVLLGDDLTGGSVLAVPMMVGIRLVGVITLHATARDAYGAEDEEVLLTMAALAATALANARLYADAQREQRQSEALADIARAVSSSLRLGEVMHLILRHAVALLRTEGASVALRRDEYLHIVAGVGCSELTAGMHLPLASSLSGRVVREGAYIISDDASREQDVYAPVQRVGNVRALIIVPLMGPDGAIGTLAVANRATPFTDDDARVLQRLADHVGVAIVNARLFEEVNEGTREWSIAFDAVAQGMVVLDESGRVRRCNQRAAQLLGDGDGDVRGCVGGDFLTRLLRAPVPPEARASLARALDEATIVRDVVRSSAEARLYELVASPHPVGGAVVTFDDVTAQHALAERYRRVVETVSDAIIITDLERRIAFTNVAARRIFGADELVGRPIREFVTPAARDALRGHEDGALAGEPQHYETELSRPDGERRLVAVSVAPLREVGEITGLVASLRDVTEERRARDAVVQGESRYRDLFESASDALYTLDAKGHFTSANATTAALTGMRADDLLARSVMSFLLAGEVARVKAAFRTALSGIPCHYECSMRRADGAIRLLSVTNTPIRRGGEVVGVLGVARDVTEDRERARALERSEARYARLVESAPDGIFTLDADGRITSLNRALEVATGEARDSLVGRALLDLVDARDRDEVRRVALDAMQGRAARTDLRYVRADGDERRASLLCSPIVERDEVTGLLGVVRDVTDEARLTEQLVRQEKLAAIGQLVSGVAHELNNPLAGVMAFSQLLLGGDPMPDGQRHAVETIHQESKRAAKIVSNLLTFARQHPPSRTATDLNQVLLDTLELRRYALRLSDIAVETVLDPALPVTWADPFQLQQVLLNLIGNAEHALLEWPGERRLHLATRRAGDALVIAVGDSGAGIAADVVDQIFNPFFTTKPVGKGTGLGLSISDGIVREHGGRMRVESRAGHGATFLVELPLAGPPPAAPEAPALREARVAAGSWDVLVIEDEPAVRAALVSHLAAAGHRADAVETGSAAMDRLATRCYDLVLLEVRLPDAHGLALHAELAARDPAQARRVVFVTGDVGPEGMREALGATGQPVLWKPFTLEELALACFGRPLP